MQCIVITEKQAAKLRKLPLGPNHYFNPVKNLAGELIISEFEYLKLDPKKDVDLKAVKQASTKSFQSQDYTKHLQKK